VFAQLRFPLVLLPQAVSSYADAKIGARRVSGFLALDDVDTSQARSSSGAGSVAITIQDGEFFWGDPVKAAEAEKQKRAEEEKKKGKK
jgi:hypothetical protein